MRIIGKPRKMSEPFASEAGPAEGPGPAMHALVRRLFPIARSITGDGVRETLRILREHIPLTIHEVPSGTRAFDWIVPQEWNIRDACIMDERGAGSWTSRQNNLHVVGYSTPVDATLTLAELQDAPALDRGPAGCDPVRHLLLRAAVGLLPVAMRSGRALPRVLYRAVIDSELTNGSLTYGEHRHPRRDGRGGVPLHLRLPSVDGQQRALGPGGHDVAREMDRQPATPLHLPSGLHPRDHRIAGLPVTPRRRPQGQRGGGLQRDLRRR